MSSPSSASSGSALSVWLRILEAAHEHASPHKHAQQRNLARAESWRPVASLSLADHVLDGEVSGWPRAEPDASSCNTHTAKPERLVEGHSHGRDELDQALHAGVPLGLHQHAVQQVQPLLDKGARVVVPDARVSNSKCNARCSHLSMCNAPTHQGTHGPQAMHASHWRRFEKKADARSPRCTSAVGSNGQQCACMVQHMASCAEHGRTSGAYLSARSLPMDRRCVAVLCWHLSMICANVSMMTGRRRPFALGFFVAASCIRPTHSRRPIGAEKAMRHVRGSKGAYINAN